MIRVLDSNRFVLGREVEVFESAWAEYCDVSDAVGVGNGLDALHMILRAIGVGLGDEVIVPANTFIATWLAVTMCGATPVSVEPNPETFNIDPRLIRDAVTSRTKAVIAVHLYGQPADLDELMALSTELGISLVEDAAQAHGALYKGKRIGGHGVAAAWSFYPGKNLGALGDGGAVTTNDPELAEKVRLLRNYGSPAKYEHAVQGVNSRLDELQAAVLLEKLKVLDEWNGRRASIAEAYTTALEPFVDKEKESGAGRLLSLPLVPSWAKPVWHLYVIRVAGRDDFVSFLSARGIETSIHYPIPPASQAAYNGLEIGSRSGFSDRTAGELVSLPIGPHLNQDQVLLVVSACQAFFRR
jgi:dTDP-4-amino-4,6-dideoxygalactose transaminase